MQNFITVFLISLILVSCKEQPEIENIIIKDVTIISMVGENTTIGNIEIVGTKIKSIGDVNANKLSTVIDGTGKYIIPGLTEMHAHIPTPEEGDDSYVKDVLFLYLSQGVTNIRGMLGDPYHLTLKESIASGELKISPRVYTSSHSLNGNSVTTPEEAEEKIRQYKTDGYDFLKIHPGIQLDVWNSVESTAKEVGIPYSGHVPVDVGIHRALDAQYATIDHIDGFIDGLIPKDQPFDKDGGGFFGYGFTDLVDVDLINPLVDKTKKQNVAIVPTQTLFTRWFSPTDPARDLLASEMKYMPSKTRFAWRQNKEQLINNEDYSAEQWSSYNSIRTQLLSALYKRGVTILLGSDAPQVMNVPGFSLHHEMKEMANAGMSNYDILKSGTSGPADFFSASGQFGTIQEKASADFILLNKHPLEDISNAQDIAGVMVRGYWLSRDMIDEGLKKIELKHAN